MRPCFKGGFSGFGVVENGTFLGRELMVWRMFRALDDLGPCLIAEFGMYCSVGFCILSCEGKWELCKVPAACNA